MSADGALNATGYIRHHLANLASAHQSSIVDFSVINYDTLFFSIAIMGLTLWLLYKAAHKATAGVPGKFQCAIEMLVEFVNDQAKTLVHGDRSYIAPLALTVFIWVTLMNCIDLLPVDLIPMIAGWLGFEHMRPLATADLNGTLGISVGVLVLMIYYGFKAHGVGGFFNDHDLPGVLVLEVTEGRDDHDPFFLLLPIGGTYLPAGILGIHVVDDLFHPDDKVIVLIAGIDVLSDGYHTHVMLFEVVDEYRSLCAVAAEARKVFYDDRIDLVLFHCFTYFFDPVPVKVHAADIVVKGFAGDGESVFLSISGNDAALIGQGIEFFVLIP